MPEGNIDSLRSSLYQKTAQRRGPKTRSASARSSEVQKKWKSDPPKNDSKKTNTKRIWWFLGGSVVFFLIAVVAAIAILSAGGRTVSPENLSIVVESPAAVASGEVYEMRFELQNNNPVVLPFVEMTIAFPNGARDPNDFSRERGHLVQDFQPLAPGAKQAVVIESVLFGEEGQEEEMLVTFEFRAEGSNAIMVRQETIPILISSAPLSLTVDVPETVVPGDSFITTARIRVHTDEPVPNVFLLGKYPFGFETLNTTPTASQDGRVWNLGTLDPGEEVEIKVEGRFATQSGIERVITFQVGTDLALNSESLNLVYVQHSKAISIDSSAIDLSVSLDGNGSDTLIVGAGKVLSGRATLTNNLGADLYGSQIQVTFEGNALDEDALDPKTGLYQPSTNTIIFNRDTDPKLEILEPTERSTVTFEVPIKSNNELEGVRNPTLTVLVTITGREVGQGGGSRPIATQIQKNIQVLSAVDLSMRLLHSTGPFTNTGSWPMRVGNRTTYTLLFDIENTLNTLAGTTVSIPIPSYVEYTGLISGVSSSAVAYNVQTGVIQISLGDLAPNEERSGALQLAVTPSADQAGNTITIVNAQSVSGVDRFTKQTVQTTVSALTSRITSDPEYTQDKGVVEP